MSDHYQSLWTLHKEAGKDRSKLGTGEHQLTGAALNQEEEVKQGNEIENLISLLCASAMYYFFPSLAAYSGMVVLTNQSKDH